MFKSRFGKVGLAGFAAVAGVILVVSSAGAHHGTGQTGLSPLTGIQTSTAQSGAEADQDVAELAADAQQEALEAQQDAAEQAAQAQEDAADQAETDNETNDTDTSDTETEGTGTGTSGSGD